MTAYLDLRGHDVQTEIESPDPAAEQVSHEIEPMDREERQIVAVQRMYRRVLADEDRLGATTLKRIDAALRGDASDE
jgi:hypothetical protein